MYLLYLDHSGEVANTNDRYFVMAGAAVFERQVYYMERDLDRLQQEHLPSATDPVEFHASAIRSHSKPPWDNMPATAREQLTIHVYDVIARANRTGLCLFGQAIEKSSVVQNFPTRMSLALKKKDEAEARAKMARGQERAEAKRSLTEAKLNLTELSSRIVKRGFEGICVQFEHFLRRFYADEDPERGREQQRGLIILDDARYENDLKVLMRQFRSSGTRVLDICNVIEPPLFTDSASTRMLQVADFVSYAVFRRYESGDTHYFDLIASRFDQNEGVVHGLAHITSDYDDCMCPACLTRKVRRRT